MNRPGGGHAGSERGRGEKDAVYKPPAAGTLMGILTDSTSPSTLQRITSSTLLLLPTNYHHVSLVRRTTTRNPILSPGLSSRGVGRELPAERGTP